MEPWDYIFVILFGIGICAKIYEIVKADRRLEEINVKSLYIEHQILWICIFVFVILNRLGL